MWSAHRGPVLRSLTAGAVQMHAIRGANCYRAVDVRPAHDEAGRSSVEKHVVTTVDWKRWFELMEPARPAHPTPGLLGTEPGALSINVESVRSCKETEGACTARHIGELTLLREL